ncbi:hypothetical protein DYE50_03465 [Treponema ruminis]|uniref:Flagellum-specific peptidoglycan hydrolase FlgJ n=1 Tax=Treponema ruminis TaxID=744515 RepID=A0A7W8G7V4_9SPIR|nr:S41 family peptidase [Treponema ruminis]MBB5225493.1 flagellum-specific peptidoglycan hydrolase FlgJ [Treponema ruminis]QSI01637.1 hypothetical protein DYE50_03465 [Treponema ruminis]
MKKVSLIQKNLTMLAFAGILSSFWLLGCASTSGGNTLPSVHVTSEEFKANALKVEPCEWKDIENPYENFNSVEKISEDQLEKDLDMFCWIFKTTYAGYENACERGLDLELLKKNIKNHFEGKEISVEEFFEVLKAELSGKIQDTHFSIHLNNWSWHFCDNYIVYWSDIFVKKTGDSFEVVEVGEDSAKLGIKTGSKYEGSTENLFYYPGKGEGIYRVGEIEKARLPAYSQMLKKTDDKINVAPSQEKSLLVSIDGKVYEIHAKSEVPINMLPNVRYGEKQTENSAYISLSSFQQPPADSKYRRGADKNFQKFMKAGSNFQDKKNIIVDLRSNSGGYDTYGTNFFINLYVPGSKNVSEYDLARYGIGIASKFWKAENFVPAKQVQSPALTQLEAMKYKKFNTQTREADNIVENMLLEQKNAPCKITYDSRNFLDKMAEHALPVPEKPHFTGKLIILIDRNSASATEEFVWTAKEDFGNQVIVVGENSSGCCEYWNVNPFRLSESKIVFYISATEMTGSLKRFKNWHGEGFGVYPDVWTNGVDLLETLVNLTSDESLREKIQNIEWGLQ